MTRRSWILPSRTRNAACCCSARVATGTDSTGWQMARGRFLTKLSSPAGHSRHGCRTPHAHCIRQCARGMPRSLGGSPGGGRRSAAYPDVSGLLPTAPVKEGLLYLPPRPTVVLVAPRCLRCVDARACDDHEGHTTTHVSTPESTPPAMGRSPNRGSRAPAAGPRSLFGRGSIYRIPNLNRRGPERPPALPIQRTGKWRLWDQRPAVGSCRYNFRCFWRPIS